MHKFMPLVSKMVLTIGLPMPMTELLSFEVTIKNVTYMQQEEHGTSTLFVLSVLKTKAK